MPKNKSAAFRAAWVYTGVILGAGFASGQELLRYFTRFGAAGFFGLGLMGVILALGGWSVLDICAKNRLDDAGAFLAFVFGKRLGGFIHAVSGLFIAIVFAAVLAGGGAMAGEVFGVPHSAGVLVVAGLCFAVFLFDLRGVVRLNAIVSPLLVAGGVFFGIYTAFHHNAAAFWDAARALRMPDNWLWSSVTYASYNMLTALCVLAGMRGAGLIARRGTAKMAGLLGGGMMCLLGVCFALPMYIHGGLTAEIPLHQLARQSGGRIEAFYLVLLASAICASAVSNGFAVVGLLLGKLRLQPLLVKAGVALGGACMAHVGFSVIVSRVYPAFGAVGIFVLAASILTALTKRKKT